MSRTCPKTIVFCSVSQQEPLTLVDSICSDRFCEPVHVIHRKDQHQKNHIMVDQTTACRMWLSHHNRWWEIISVFCWPTDTSDHFTWCNISIHLLYHFASTHTWTKTAPSFGILISRIPSGCGIEDRNGINETRDERPPTLFSPKSCLSEKPPNTQRKWGGAPPLTSRVLMWRVVWILRAFIYFITDPGPAGGNKADGMF